MQRNAMRITEEFSTVGIATRGGHTHNTPVSVAAARATGLTSLLRRS